MMHIILIFLSLIMLAVSLKQNEKSKKRIVIALLCISWGVLSLIDSFFTLGTFPITFTLLTNTITCALSFIMLSSRDHKEGKQ